MRVAIIFPLFIVVHYVLHISFGIWEYTGSCVSMTIAILRREFGYLFPAASIASYDFIPMEGRNLFDTKLWSISCH